MKTPEEIVRGLEFCADTDHAPCPGTCPYAREKNCFNMLKKDALEYLRSLANNAVAPKTTQEAPGRQAAWTREKILDVAKMVVCGHREQDYGTPEDSFGMIAQLWSAYMKKEVSASDVAVMMGLLKVARLASNPQHMDSWVDLAGYAACGGEINGKEA